MQAECNLDRLIGTYGRLNIEVQDLRGTDGSVRIRGHADAVSIKRNFGLDDYMITSEETDGQIYTVIRYDSALAESNAAPKEHVPIFAKNVDEMPTTRNVSRIKRESKRIEQTTARSAVRMRSIRAKSVDSGVQARAITLPAEAVRTSYAGRAAAMKMSVDELVEAYLNNDTEAILKLARLMESGTGNRAADPGLAVRLYGRAAELGSAKGLYHLGMCYLKGVGFSRADPAYARCLLEAAAGFGDSSAKVSMKDIDCEASDRPAEGVDIMDVEHTDIKFRCNMF